MNEHMILLAGIPTESPLSLVRNELVKLGVHTVVFNQRAFNQIRLDWDLTASGIRGALSINDCSYDLDRFTGAYTRFMSEFELPEMKENDEQIRKKGVQLHQSLHKWLEVTPCKVVNRNSTMFSNSSKPYQALIIRQCGLMTPPTLISNDPETVLEFYRTYKSVIYKSISGVRSIVKEFDPKQTEQLEKIRYCPVQFQQKIDGFDVRVHVIGNKTIATKILTTGIDYRYANREGGKTSLEPFSLPETISKACVKLSKRLQLNFSGIDLRFAEDGRVYCFEVNPMPGYSYYELNTGQKIAETLAQYLIGVG